MSSRRLELAALLGAVLCLALGLLRLGASAAGVERTEATAGATPVTVYAPDGDGPAPVVVVAHGFAGARPLMQAFSYSLAQSGYVAVAFDFPGHGAHPRPLGGTLGSPARVASLRGALSDAVGHARGLAAGDRRVALLGHSMAGDILVRHALEDPAIAAVVGLSPYLEVPIPAGALGAPLLVAYGGWENDMLVDMGREAVAPVAGVPPEAVEAGRTYGAETPRRLEIIEGAEHIGILFSPAALHASVSWLDDALGRTRAGAAPVTPRRLALALYYLGVVLLALVLARRLPVVSDTHRGAGVGGQRFAVAAVLPALLTPLVLTPLPTDFLPSLLTDHLALHLAVYGLLTAAFLRAAGARLRHLGRGLRLRPFLLALGLVLLFEMIALGLATDRFLSAFFPGPNRGLATVAAFVGATIYFVADEWLTRGPGAPRLAYAVTKTLFLVSLVLAVVLNPSELFFLVIIVPAVLLLFVVYGLLSRWIHARTGHPLVAALAHALAFALAISATFPVVEATDAGGRPELGAVGRAGVEGSRLVTRPGSGAAPGESRPNPRSARRPPPAPRR